MPLRPVPHMGAQTCTDLNISETALCVTCLLHSICCSAHFVYVQVGSLVGQSGGCQGRDHIQASGGFCTADADLGTLAAAHRAYQLSAEC